ncbi:ATPase, T2SS/T4P/T4SS family [Halomonas sp. RA08-2]|uniref:ATPase, T2SS/T4P/T4SS family n=1 Tax=Halomonas sp. RA08-2 TaxID=3440842 RepID=UPI003EE9F291
MADETTRHANRRLLPRLWPLLETPPGAGQEVLEAHALLEETWLPGGCDRCDGLGFRGRTGVFEVWQPTAADHGLILRNADESRLRRALLERGETLMLQDGLTKAEQGITSLREVLRMGALLPS